MDERVFVLKNSAQKGKRVIYWMSREQRAEYNFGLLTASEYAKEHRLTLVVAFCLVSEFLGAAPEAFAFMGEGLPEVEADLKAKNIPFRLLHGHPPTKVAGFAKEIEAQAVFVDFDPLRIKRAWCSELLLQFVGSVFEVDSHNIVPTRLASGKKEFAAYTIRPKIKKLLPRFLVEPPELVTQNGAQEFYENDFSIFESLPKNRYFGGGRGAALERLKEFLTEKLDAYGLNRNDPTKDAQSELSPYLHFGHISALEVALAVEFAKANEESKAAFLEELIVRKELADNFCFYCDDYDNENSLEPWAKANVALTDEEPREYIYSLAEFEEAVTHDELWNGAQNELKLKGKIHGYMRMYWAKKILEWTPGTKDALKIAVYLNDRYALDGRDPSGYAGIAWSLGGVHDRAWPSRKVFGKVRYMNYNGCKSKFDIKKYILKIKELGGKGQGWLF
jgi:deoxyribodipyrimidine photo-lyase